MRRASVIANPEALTLNHRYIDCGLNRSFRPSFLTPPTPDGPPEVQRARALLARWGWQGNQPWLPATQRRLGLPVHLHEGDPTQTGFPWPCGLVIKVGSVAHKGFSMRASSVRPNWRSRQRWKGLWPVVAVILSPGQPIWRRIAVSGDSMCAEPETAKPGLHPSLPRQGQD